MQNPDGLVFGAAPGTFLVQVFVGFGFKLIEIRTAFERALFDDDDIKAGAGQQLGGDAGTGAGANDGHIAMYLFGQGGVLAAEYFPATAESVPDGVFEFAHGYKSTGPG